MFHLSCCKLTVNQIDNVLLSHFLCHSFNSSLWEWASLIDNLNLRKRKEWKMKRNSDKISVYFQAFYFIIYFPSDSSLKCTSTAASSIEDGTISNWLTVESINRKKASKTVEPHVIMNWVSKSICRTFSTRNRNISSMDLYPFQSEKCVKILEMKHLNCRTPISWLFISLSLSLNVCLCVSSNLYSCYMKCMFQGTRT